MTPCLICGGSQTPVYTGPVRHGTFGRSVEGVVWRCDSCGAEYLPPEVDPKAFYAGSGYREIIGEAADPEDYFRRHDSEQLPKLNCLEHVPLRGRIIADIGCGGGSFLDCVSGMARTTIGIEPMAGYHDSLRSRGHRHYASTEDAQGEWLGRVDIAVSFSVIEHVPDPKGFLSSIRPLLAPGGKLILSTPNRNDVLMSLDLYKAFFYRTVHTYYFDVKSLTELAAAAGFSSNIRFVHRFGFANYVGWLKEGRPTQNSGPSPLPQRFDAIWKATLEAEGIADYLYAELTPL